MGFMRNAAIGVALVSVLLTGCGSEEMPAAGKTQVKVMKVLRQDTPVSYGYPGHLQGREEVQVHSRVSSKAGTLFTPVTPFIALIPVSMKLPS